MIRVWDYFMRRKGLLLLLIAASVTSGLLSSYAMRAVPDLSPVSNIPDSTVSDPATLDPATIEPSALDAPTSDSPSSDRIPSDQTVDFPEIQIIEPSDEQPAVASDLNLAPSADSELISSDAASSSAAPERLRLHIANPDEAPQIATTETVNLPATSNLAASDPAVDPLLEVPLTGATEDSSAAIIAAWQDIARTTTISLLGAFVIIAILRWLMRREIA